jgi:hypothetical protein
MSPDLQK